MIAELARETQAGAVFWNEIAQAPHQAVADQVAAALTEIGLSSHCFPGDLLAAPANIRNKDGPGLAGIHAVLAAVQASGDPPKPLPGPKALCPGPHIGGDTIESWRLEATNPEWAGDLGETWKPGELTAQARLAEFLQTDAAGYSTEGDRLDRNGTHLRFGEVSPRQLWRASRFAAAERPALAGDIDKYLTELGWREFCRHLFSTRPISRRAVCSPRSTHFRGGMTKSRCGRAARPNRLSHRRSRDARACGAPA